MTYKDYRSCFKNFSPAKGSFEKLKLFLNGNYYFKQLDVKYGGFTSHHELCCVNYFIFFYDLKELTVYVQYFTVGRSFEQVGLCRGIDSICLKYDDLKFSNVERKLKNLCFDLINNGLSYSSRYSVSIEDKMRFEDIQEEFRDYILNF